MSNFTKSIVYSGLVLVAGLVAVFSIYNNMGATNASGYAQMEPAAGNEAAATAEETGVDATQAVEGMAVDTANETVEETVDEMAAEQGLNAETTDAAKDIVDGTAVEEQAKDIAAEHVEQTKEEVQEMAKDAAEEAVETATEGTEPAAGTEETKETAQ